MTSTKRILSGLLAAGMILSLTYLLVSRQGMVNQKIQVEEIEL